MGCGDTQGLDSSSPALRLCCPARRGVGSRHAILSARAVPRLANCGVETHRGSIPPLRRCGCAAQRGAASAAAMPFCRPAQSQGWPIVVWRHTRVRFLLSGAAAVLPSVVRHWEPPCHSVGLRNHRADLSWRGDTQVLDSSSPGCCRAARASVRGWQQKPCSCVPIADVQSVLMACTAARSQPKLGCPGGLARLRGRCLFGSCPLSSVPRRSKLKNAGVSRAGART